MIEDLLDDVFGCLYSPKGKTNILPMPESLPTGSAAIRAFHTAMAKAAMMSPGVRKGMTFR